MKKRMKNLVIALVLGFVGTVWADAISYLSPTYVNPSDVKQGISGWTTESCSAATSVSATDLTWGDDGNDGWYVLDSDVSINGTVTVSGNVKLILKDGYKLTVSQTGWNVGAINIPLNATLTVFSQSDGVSQGALEANGGWGGAGIGFTDGGGSQGGSVVINGGQITARGGSGTGSYSAYSGGAGIGTGRRSKFTSIVINGGIIDARGKSNGAGIGVGGPDGSGFADSGPQIVINGGQITAVGGGDPAVTVGGGAGIGGSGMGCSTPWRGAMGPVYINGGTISATGGIGGAGNGDAIGIGYSTAGAPGTGTVLVKGVGLKVRAGNVTPPTETIENTGLSLYESLRNKQYATVKADLPGDILEQPSSTNDFTFVVCTNGYSGTVTYQWFRKTGEAFEPVAGETSARIQSQEVKLAGGMMKCTASFIAAGTSEPAFTVTSDVVEVKMSDEERRRYFGMKAAEVLVGGTDIESATLLEASFVMGNVDEQVAIFGPTNLATEVYDPYLFGTGSAGIALSSGWATYAITNSTSSETCNNKVTGGKNIQDPYLHEETGYELNDSISLELKVKSKLSGVLTFDYILASREMDQSVSDPFALFVRDCGTAEAPEENDYQNVAFMPEELNGKIGGWTSNVVVEIKRLQEVVRNVENYSDYVTINGSAGSYSTLPNTGWNVFTTTYQTKFTAKKDHIYQIRIVTADLSDQIYDTVVYLRADSLRVKPNPPTLTGAPGVVKDGVFQYTPGQSTVAATVKADRAGVVYFVTKKCTMISQIQNSENWLCAPVLIDAGGDGAVDLPAETGAYYAYYVDAGGNFSNGMPFWVAPHVVELASIVYDANDVAFADGTTLKTNTQTRYTFTVDPGFELLLPDGHVLSGWYLDAACTEKYAFGGRLEDDLTLYAGHRVATGLIIEGKDIAVDLKGDGWSYDYGDDDYVEIDYNATKPVEISGTTTNTAIYLYYANYYGNKTVLNNVTVDYKTCTYEPLYCEYGAEIELKGTNAFYATEGNSAFYGYKYTYVITGREDGSDALFLYPGEGADAVELYDATLKIRGGTYNDVVSPSYVDTSYGYAAFDNGNSTWTAALAWRVTFDGKNGESATVVPVKRGQPVAKPLDPKNGEYAFAGWYTDEACTAGSEYDFTAAVTEDRTLYAKWVEAKAFVEDEDGKPAAAKDFGDAIVKVPEGGQIAVSETNITDTVVIEKEVIIHKGSTDDLSGVTPGADLVKTNSGDTVVVIGEPVGDMTVVVRDRKPTVEPTEKPASKTDIEWQTLTDLANEVRQSGIFAALEEKTKTNFVDVAKAAFAAPNAVDAVLITVSLKVTPKNVETFDDAFRMYQYDAQPVASIVAFTNGVMKTVADDVELHTGDALVEGAWFQVTLPSAGMMPRCVLHRLSDGTIVRYMKGAGEKGEITFAHDAVDNVVRLWVQENSDFYVLAYLPEDVTVSYDAMGGRFGDGSDIAEVTGINVDGYVFPEVPVRSGYTFDGWFDGVTRDGVQRFEGEGILDRKLFASWTIIPDPIHPIVYETAFTGGLTSDGYGATNLQPTAQLVASGATDLVIPDKVAGVALLEIGRNAFRRSYYQGVVTSAKFGVFVNCIRPYAFRGSAVTNVEFSVPHDYLTGEKTTLYIQDRAFWETEVETLVFPAGGSYSLGQNAFSDNGTIKDVYFYGELDKNCWKLSPFRHIGEGRTAANAVRFHLRPSQAADADFVWALTNGMDAACIVLDQNVLGSVKTGSFSVGAETLVIDFTVNADSPWQNATVANTYLLFSGDLTEVVVGKGNVLKPESVEKQPDGSYKATFAKPAEATGFFVVCVGE